MGNVKIKCEIEVDRQRIADVVCSGFEGGIGYWATITGYVPPPKDADLYVGREDDRERGLFKHIDYPMCEEGGGVVLGDAENDGKGFDLTANGGGRVTLTYAGIVKGLGLMATKHPRHFSNLVADDGDAETGDVLIQLAVFGDIVYG